MPLYRLIALLPAALAGLYVGLHPATAEPAESNATLAGQEPEHFTNIRPEIARVDLDTYVSLAQEILRGKVVYVAPIEGDARMPWTEIGVRVEEIYKGNPPDLVPVRVVGLNGHADMIVPNAPLFAQGEEVLLFLNTVENESWRGILGLGEGTYRIADSRVIGRHAEAGDSVDRFEERIAMRLK